MSGREKDFIDEAFAENWIVPLGPNVTGFEKDLENYFISRHVGQVVRSRRDEFASKRVVALASGTAALHLGLVALGVGRDDEVMVQSLTFSASANPVVYQGARPVFVDSEPETWNIDPVLLDAAIADRIATTGRKPKAIIAVNLYGMPCKMKEILDVAAKWDIPVLEDAAESFGSLYRSLPCGTFGKYGVLSFNGNKMITTSGGGALICPDETEARNVLNYATQSREARPWYEHTRIGFNYRMSNVCAGIGRGQMTIADQHLQHHRYIQARYRELLADIPELTLHENPGPEFDSNFWLCTVSISENAHIAGDADASAPELLRRHLETFNIETRQLWKPMHLQPFFRECPAYVNGVSQHLFDHGLCLPSGPWVGEKELQKVVWALRSGIS